MAEGINLQEMDELLYDNLEKLNFAIDNFRDVKTTIFSFRHREETEYPDNPEDGVQKKHYKVQVSMNKDGRLKSLKLEVSIEYDKV